MKPMCNVLDILSKIEWKLNEPVLDVMNYVWAIGGGIGGIPKRYNERVITPEMIKDAAFREKLKLLKEHQHNRETHGLRCEWVLRMNIANSFKSCRKIYFPHNCDFRGRVYPIPPHLNHMGPDINRGMLNFSEGKPIGKEGLWWLKVHLSNKWGQDKLPLNERAKYAESMMEDVHRMAEDPKNNLDWLKADNPWQALGAIFELSAALNSPVPEEYISHIHVHVDGSCNGMQHYAAFGRDENGGKQVNLADGDRPGDVYTAILKLVIQDIEKEQDPELIPIAESLKGKISRKVIKQTVMTSVYGVTFIGARQQIQRQLKDRKLYDTNGELYRASNYLARRTIKCIGDLFSDANQIKDWFAKCARIVAATGEPVKWRSPLGLPCVQPYKYISKSTVVNTIIQSLNVAKNLDEQPVNKAKNTTAFPPNFVHSIDSTHMMLTALECEKEGITFAAVHDSYWTHPSDITRMNAILRQ